MLHRPEEREERERSCSTEWEGGEANVERQFVLSLSLSLLAETKSTKVCACSRGSLPMARRGNNDGRHMGDSPGAQRERACLLTFLPPFLLLSRSLFVYVPLCGPDFTGLGTHARTYVRDSKRGTTIASPPSLRRWNDSAKTWRRREIARVTHR